MFDFSDEQLALQDRIRSFAKDEIGADLYERDKRGAVDEADWRSDWEKCGKAGLLSLLVPEAYGGQGLDVTTSVLALEALGYGCADNGIGLATNGTIWAVQEPIMTFGSEAQKEKYLPALADGSMIGAHGLTEAETGSDATALKTTATPKNGGYVLNGEKVYVGMAPVCDMAIVFANTSPEAGLWGVSAFLIEVTDDGFERGPADQKMGLRTVPMGALTMKDCWVPEERRLGPEGAGSSIFQSTMEWERCFIFSSHVGSMARQLDDCVAYAQQRETFGKPIIEHQSISNRLADMRVRLETCRLMLFQAASLKDRGIAALQHAAMVKLHVAEAFVESSLDAIRVHGGTGYMSANEIDRDLRDSIGGVIYSGTSDIQRQIIARLL